jgi:hypothetical protein
VLVTAGDPPGMSSLKLFAVKPDSTTAITELHFTEAVTAVSPPHPTSMTVGGMFECTGARASDAGVIDRRLR